MDASSQAWKESYNHAIQNWGKNWDQVIASLEDAERDARRDLGIFDSDYLTVLNDLGIANYEAGNLEKAIYFLDKSEAYCSEVYTPKDHQLISAKLNLARIYMDVFPARALELYSQILQSGTSDAKIEAIRSVYLIHTQLGKPDSADEFLNSVPRDSSDYEIMYMVRILQADHARRTGHLDDAGLIMNEIEQQLANETDSLRKKSVETVFIEQQGLLSLDKNEFLKAEMAFKKVLELKDYLGLPPSEKVNTINNLATLYEKFGLYDKALELINDAIERCDGNCEKLFQNKATIYLRKGNLLQAEVIYNEIYANHNFRSPRDELIFLLNYSHTYQSGSEKLSNPALEKAASIVEQNSQFLTRKEIADFYAAKGAWLIYTGKIEEAVEVLEDARLEYLKVSDEYAPVLRKIDINLAVCNLLTGNNTIAMEYLERANKNEEYLIRYIFPLLSRSEQTIFLGLLKEDIDLVYSAVNEKLKDNPELSRIIFEKQILYKGLTLQSKRASNQLYRMDQGNIPPEVLSEYKALRNRLSREFSEGGRGFEFNSDDMSRLRELDAIIARNTGDISWDDNSFESISASLGEREALIEIVRFTDQNLRKRQNIDTTQYLALIIRSGQTFPAYVNLSDGSYLEEKQLKYYLNAIRFDIKDTLSYAKFWQPMESQLRDIDTCYLVADGVYFKINPAAFFDPSRDDFLGDHMSIQLLNNASDIISVKKEKGNYAGGHEALLIGDPLLGKNSNGLFESLPGAKREILEIEKLFTKNEWQASLLTGENATRTNISNAEMPGLVHFATHGFFSRKEVAQLDQLPDLALFRSGLIVSDPNSAKGDLYTAFDVSGLDMSATELVVLSACETGLGELRNGDGVYGLQYAFFVAGAKSMLISLWQVSDQMTFEFMTEFYRKLLVTGNKRMAYDHAVQAIRLAHPQPRYWAPFIYLGH